MGIQKDKLTEEQKKELERLRQYAARNRLSARMNGTKWRAAIDAVAAMEGYRPSFRYRDVTVAADPAPGWDEAFPRNIPLYNSMEWLELNARSADAPPKAAWKGKGGSEGDFREALLRALGGAGIPTAETAEGVRIIGYDRPAR